MRLTAEDGLEMATTAPSCGHSLSPQPELRRTAAMATFPPSIYAARDMTIRQRESIG
jgi:hypothetical protein